MAFDPMQEDCLRLTLEAMRREHVYPLDNPAFVERCMDAYREDPAQLIKTDRDRSYHLMTLATEIIDYRIPFMSDDDAADEAAWDAEGKLREAAALDPSNWDARRMLAALEAPSNDAYVSFLLDHVDEVRDDLERVLDSISNSYDRDFAGSIAWRPYVRWLAATASRALIAGQYRLSLDFAERCLAFMGEDPAGARHTAVLAMAKLECSRDELKRFRAKHASSYLPPVQLRRRHHLDEKAPDAWLMLAELACAYHEFDYNGATRVLRSLLKAYPRAAEPLYFQAEFPDGVYARVNVEPGSEDELILAISEATPLLQEGIGAPSNASLAYWIASHDLVEGALEEHEAAAEGKGGKGGLN